MTTLAIPPWGNYSIALAASVECLRVTPWSTRSTTPEIMALGAEAAPEFSCLAFKATTGYFIKAAQEGAEYGVMVNSVGTCRLRYYRELQQKILKDRGLNLFIFGLGYDGIKPPLIRHFDPTMGDFLRCSARAFFKVHAVDAIERLAWKTRARERHVGDTTRLMNACLKDLDEARTVKAIRAVARAVPARFGGVATDDGSRPLRIGLLGEASILRDSYLNHNLEETLGSLGVEVRNFFLLGNEMAKIFNIGLWRRDSRHALARLARPYLKSRVGGHAQESIAYTVACARERYDGVVHVSPTGCMPEISIRPILRKVSRDLDIPVLELSFDEHSSHVGVVTRLEAFVDILRERGKAGSPMTARCYLGIDVGSISTNLALMDAESKVLFAVYRRVDGNPIHSVQKAIQEMRDALPDAIEVAGVGATGSARALVGAVIGADVVKNEISAHARAAVHLHPEAQTVFEIGGQDSKVTILRNGIVVDFAMNLVCAAGTGSFLDSQAKRLNISIEELGARALLSRDPTAIAGRCTVFAESDMIHKQQTGHQQHDIVMGLCHAMVRNFLSNVCAGKEIRAPIVLQGGVSANPGIRRAFNEALKTEVIVPKHNMVMGAYGAALLAARANPARSRFRGYGLCDREIVTRCFRCEDCPNRCEVIEIVDHGQSIGRSGGRCRKWERSGAESQ